MNKIIGLFCFCVGLFPWGVAWSDGYDLHEFMVHQQARALIAPQSNARHAGQPWILVGVRSQTLTLFDGRGRALRRYLVSTAKNGVGEREGSYQTPRGWHTVCDRVGDGVEADTIIVKQRVTPWKYTPQLHAEFPQKDWILTRILWLCGQEAGINLGVNTEGEVVDSYQRLIYIHGAGAHVRWGEPTSLGCVRMSSADVMALFELVSLDLDVLIDAEA